MDSSSEQRAALTTITGRASDSLAAWWPVIQGEALADALMEIADIYGLAAGTLAADWYSDLRVAADAPGRFVTVPAAMPTAGLFRAIADKVSAGSPDTALARAQGEMQRVVANAHRDTITQLSDEDDEASGWRRVGDGHNCDFCNMLIGRGAVYKASTARFASHQHCNCVAAPAFGGGPAMPARPYTRSNTRMTQDQRDRMNRRTREWIAANQ